MSSAPLGPLTITCDIERWRLSAPFRITGLTRHEIDLLVVAVEQNGHVGRGEAVGVHYLKDNPLSMLAQINAARARIEGGITRDSLRDILPAGGARSALDAALWDLEAKVFGRNVWQIAHIDRPRPLVTALTCGADTPAQMAIAARAYSGAKMLKLKLTGEDTDAARVRAVREARPDVRLTVDANQGFSLSILERLLPSLVEADVMIIEQPFPKDQDELLDSVQSPIPIAADESAQTIDDLPRLVGRYSIVNIKLDKCGGLTEGLAMHYEAKKLGLHTWVGNTMGTSLAMAPAFLLGQRCDYAELDGPLFLLGDRAGPIEYSEGKVFCPSSLWGSS